MDVADRTQRLRTVQVPEPFEDAFLRAEKYVQDYYAIRSQDPTEGTVRIFDERYVNVRAAALSVEFYDVVKQMYDVRSPEESDGVARALLFDIAHAIGMADARNFHARMGVDDPIERLSAGPIHFAYAGWAFVSILPESAPSPDEDYFLVYDHPFSFESDSWIAAGKTADAPVCVMNAGYSSGWCEESFGLPLVATEISCRASGHERCRFVMAHPDRLKEKTESYIKTTGLVGLRTSSFEIPGFFDRKRAQEELRKSNQVLADNLMEEQRDLADANRELREAVAEVDRLRKLALDASPLTGLPGAVTVEREIERALRNDLDVAVLYIDLDQFKAFNDAYGFMAGNDVIRFTATTLMETVEPTAGWFVGHVGGDDFVAICPADMLHVTADRICQRFDRGIRAFYGDEDLDRGHIVSFDRRGVAHQFPVMTVSLGAVLLSRRAYEQPFQVSEACAEVKLLAKQDPKSCLRVDRRSRSARPSRPK